MHQQPPPTAQRDLLAEFKERHDYASNESMAILVGFQFLADAVRDAGDKIAGRLEGVREANEGIGSTLATHEGGMMLG